MSANRFRVAHEERPEGGHIARLTEALQGCVGGPGA